MLRGATKSTAEPSQEPANKMAVFDHHCHLGTAITITCWNPQALGCEPYLLQEATRVGVAVVAVLLLLLEVPGTTVVGWIISISKQPNDMKQPSARPLTTPGHYPSQLQMMNFPSLNLSNPSKFCQLISTAVDPDRIRQHVQVHEHRLHEVFAPVSTPLKEGCLNDDTCTTLKSVDFSK